MGEITIKIPTNKTRRYIVTDPARVDSLISVLEKSAIRLKQDSDQLSDSQMEDIRDGEAAQHNLDEMRRTGISHSVDELRKEFGLS